MQYIVNDIEEVVKLIQDASGAPYFFKGHRVEVSNILSLMDKDSVRKKERYPAIILNMDIEEKPVDTFIQYTLTIFIVAPTIVSPRALYDDRYDQVIAPVLFPIYDAFVEALGNAGLFFWDGSLTMPPHTRIVRPYWGVPTPERNRAFYVDDKLDCIEIKNLLLNRELECKTY